MTYKLILYAYSHHYISTRTLISLKFMTYYVVTNYSIIVGLFFPLKLQTCMINTQGLYFPQIFHANRYDFQ